VNVQRPHGTGDLGLMPCGGALRGGDAARRQLPGDGATGGGRLPTQWSYLAIAANLDADGVKPARAARWSAETVRRVVLAA
jgi:hypothetical protein